MLVHGKEVNSNQRLYGLVAWIATFEPVLQQRLGRHLHIGGADFYGREVISGKVHDLDGVAIMGSTLQDEPELPGFVDR